MNVATALAFLLALSARAIAADATPPAADTAPKLVLEADPLDPPQVDRRRASTLEGLSEFDVTLRGGMVLFTGDFQSDPEPCVGLLLRTPVPWFSRALGGRLGLFLSGTASSIEREAEPAFQEPKGDLLFGEAGLDLAVATGKSFTLSLQAGGQYADYGDVSRLDNGFGLLTGARTGVRVVGNAWLTYDFECVFVQNQDLLLFNFLGLAFGF